MLDFTYDESGKPFALIYTNGTAEPVTYYYVLNLQGDVVGLINASGTFVAKYTYTAWGEIQTSTGDMATINPLRYRGYYYDVETGFYYLQSRYYDPANHRFINADSLTSTNTGFLGYNMFAYCLNNPSSRTDIFGLYPGDLFDTPEEAAANFGNCYNGASINSKKEYGAFIYEVPVTEPRTIKFLGWTLYEWSEQTYYYSYSDPVVGSHNKLILPFQEKVNGYTTVAVVHTHDAYDEELGNEKFSTEDAMTIINNKTVGYLVTPSGQLKKFDPMSGNYNGRIIRRDLVHDPASHDLWCRNIGHIYCGKCAYKQ